VPSSNPAQRFQDILDNVARIERFTAGQTLERFVEDEEKVFAVKHALLIISEAAVKLGDLAPKVCPEIDWRDVRGLGNRLRHEYHTIDVVQLWRIVDRHLPALKIAVETALFKLQEGNAE
jgi:uncharacterized protein with HEPN domain